MSLIEINNLKYRYPQTSTNALNDLSLSIEAGEFIGLVGANGAGKSTLCQALLGLVPHFYKGKYAGEVQIMDMTVRDTDIADLAPHVGMVFQNPFTQMTGSKDTVFEEVAFGLENLGLAREEMIARVNQALADMDIEKLRDKNPFDLSGGQMQRVAIASIIAMRPDVLILDEPTSQLDPAGSDEVFQVVSKLADSGITIIMAEQKIDKIAQYADRVVLMAAGQVIDFDTPQEVFSRDDVEDFGIEAPLVTQIAKRLGVKDGQGYYPVTVQGFKEVVGHG
jgi:energy-coupling factor transporter ATP-binding protein EcfA2